MSTHRDHEPENAEFELQKAFNCVIETGVTHFWDRRAIPGVNPDEVITIYRRAFNAHRQGDRLSAERWARTAKHLARAFWHEAKIAYFAPRTTTLPFLERAAAEAYQLHGSERPDTTADLLNSVADHVPPGMTEMPEELRRYANRAREHLRHFGHGGQPVTGERARPIVADEAEHELLRAERIKAAHEYARVLECAALAYDAALKSGRTAA